jgi:hypothetical protein
MVSASCARGAAASTEMGGNTNAYFVAITLDCRRVAHFCYSRSDFDACYLCAEILKDFLALRVYKSQFLALRVIVSTCAVRCIGFVEFFILGAVSLILCMPKRECQVF